MFWALSLSMSTVEEETEYDNYAAQETKRVSEEEVMQKLEDSYKASKSAPESTSSVDEDDDPMAYFSKVGRQADFKINF